MLICRCDVCLKLDLLAAERNKIVITESEITANSALQVVGKFKAEEVAGGWMFANRRQATQAASELAGDLGSNPTRLYLNEFVG